MFLCMPLTHTIKRIIIWCVFWNLFFFRSNLPLSRDKRRNLLAAPQELCHKEIFYCRLVSDRRESQVILQFPSVEPIVIPFTHARACKLCMCLFVRGACSVYICKYACGSKETSQHARVYMGACVCACEREGVDLRYLKGREERSRLID